MTQLYRFLAQARPQIEASVWFNKAHDWQSMDEFVAKMEAVGNTILERDDEAQRVLVGEWTEDQDRWGCTLCLAHGQVTITDSQDELGAHLDHAHPGWDVNEKGEPVVPEG